MRLRIPYLAVLLHAGLMVACVARAGVGRIPATHAVSPTGGFTYSIPIWLPPGPHGVQPQLTLVYDSTVDSTPSDDMPLAGTSGLDEIPAGAGWVLKGLSAIQRTNATVADDGTAADYSFSINDPYSLDGNRLRLMGSGDYGEDGSTYRTELDNFAQVTAHGSTADGPEYWTAQLKNGLTYEYGNTSDSQILLPGGTDGEIREWLLDKVSDAYGNSYVVTYGPGTSGTVGVAVPMSISWTPSSAGASDYNYTVKFTYSSRASTELITGYVDGQSLSNDTLLHTITVSYNGTVVRYYQLNYTSSSTGTGRSLLGSIDECSDSTMTECLTPTGFSYAGGAPGVGSASGTAVSGATSIIGVYDFDGTGRSDILYNSGGTLYVAFADGSGFTQVNTGVSASGYYVVGDLVGRGIDDILASVNGTWWRYTWDSASNSFSGSSTGIAAPAAGSSGVAVELADVNGDGLPDLITLTTAPIGDESFYSGTISTTLNTSSAGAFSLSGSSTTFETPACGPNDDVACQPVLSTPVDATGDRRQDLVLSVIGIAPDSPAVTNYYTLIPQGDSYTVSTTITGSAQGVKWNDDDCSDFVGGSEVVISACNGNAGQTLSFAGTAVGTVDWNGDGLQDVLVDDNDTLGVYTSTGNGISALAPTSIALGAGDTVVPLNVTGSGLPDIGVENGGMMTYYLHNVVVSLPDLLTAVTDGNGNTITAAYTSISAGAYTMGSGAQDPESNWIGDLWVVQSLTLPDGTGGTYTKTYYYSDARWSRLRGLEGFSSVQTTDSRNQEIRRTSYDLLFPLTGLMSEDDLFQSDGTTPIEKKTYSNTVENLDSTQFNERYLPYAETVTVGTYGVGGSENGQEIKKSETTYTPDQYGYGNFTSIASTLTDEDPDSPFSGDQWQTTTTAQYVDDASTWCLSLPSSIAVAKTAPGGEATITHTTTFNRDGSNCRAVSETQDAGMADFDVTRAFEYDAFGNISQMTVTGAGMSPRTSTYGWGEAGQFEEEIQNSVAHADGYEEKIGYDYALGLKKSDVIESTGGTQNAPPTEWSYDGLGRLTQETFPDGTTLNWSYNSCSSGCYGGMETVAETANATQSSGGAEITDQSTYVDSFGRPVATTKRLMDGSYSLVEQRYDAFGNITQKSAPCKSCSSPEYWTQITYDALKRPTQIESPAPWTSGGEGTTNIAYAGDKTTITNADTEVKTRITDASGALRSITDAEGYEVDFTPDSDGNVSSVADSNGTITARTYDYGGAGDYVYTMSDRALSEGSALQWVYTRDALGDVCSYTDAKGQEFLMRYDGLGRPIERDDGVEGFSGGCSGSATSDETSTQWTWGETPADHDVGELDEAETATADGTYVEQDSYDADGRLQYRNIAIPGDGTYQYSYAYSPTTGLLSELQYPAAGSAAGLALDYGYSYGVLSSVTDASNGTVYWQDSNPVSVNALGESTQDTLGNGIVTQTAFTDVTGWPTRIISGPTAGSASVQNQTFSYDPLGNVIQRQDSNVGLTENFYYDPDNRLSSSSLSNGSTTTTNLQLSYNLNGSIAQKTETGGTDDPVQYDVTDWTSYNYPQSISATLPSGQTEGASFDYGPDRRRWRMVYTEGSASETTEYIGRLMEKVSDSSSTEYRYYVYGASGLAAVVAIDGSTVTPHYVLEDQEGSISSLLNSTGSVAVNESFTAFGNRREPSTWSGPPSSAEESTADGITRQGFTGHTVLGQMGLNHMNGRVEDAITGTFLSPDPYVDEPYQTQDYYRYAYTYDNPLTYIDPTGFECVPSYTSTDDSAGEAGEPGEPFANVPSPIMCTVNAPPVLQPDPLGQLDLCLSCYTPEPAPNVSLPGVSPGASIQPAQLQQSNPCASALKTAGQTQAAVNRADAAWAMLQTAANAHGIDPALLAAIGVRETGFQNVWQAGNGWGAGVFQIDLSKNPGVTVAQAFDVSWAANYAAGVLASNESAISARFPNFTAAQVLQATAASYNFGSRNISGNPNTIDQGSAHNNYGSNVMGLMQCFK